MTDLKDRAIALLAKARQGSLASPDTLLLDWDHASDIYAGYFEGGNGDLFAVSGNLENGEMVAVSTIDDRWPILLTSRPSLDGLSSELANGISSAHRLIEDYVLKDDRISERERDGALSLLPLLGTALRDSLELKRWPIEARRWLVVVWDVFEAEHQRRWITVPEAVDRANKLLDVQYGQEKGLKRIKETTLYKRIERGQLPYRESGRTKLVRWSDVQRYVQASDGKSEV